MKRRRLGSVPVRGGNVSVHAGVSDETAHLGCAGDRSRCSLRLPTAEGLTRVSIAVSVLAGPAPVGEPLPIAVTVRNRGSRPALDVRTCVRLPRGLGLARSGGRDAAQRRVCWRIARLAPRARRFLRITGTSAACAPHERSTPPSVATTCASAPRGSDSRSLARRSSRATQADHGRAG